MGRWEADAQGRLRQAALELFTQRGFEQTTVADIAERAGVTERTFFRYFADKREVLFDGSSALQKAVVEAIAASGTSRPPLATVVAAVASAGPIFEERREFSRLRAAAIAADTSLMERELLKLATLATAAAEALRATGVPEPAASLAAQSGITVFRVGFERWIADDSGGSLAQHLHDALAELKALS